MKIYLIIFFLITPELLSQTGGDTIESPEIETESLLESGTEDVEDSELLDRIIWLKDNPIELNTATAEDLLQIPYLDALMTRNILQYRRRIESFSSVSQLKNVDGMDEGLYNRIVSFLYVKDSQLDYIKDEYGDVRKAREELKRGLLGRVKLNLRSRFSNDLQPAAGYLNGRYFGTKPKVYNRLGVIYSASGYKFSGSLLTEKDAGEKSLADHVAGYVEMKSPLVLSQFLLGDYTLEFGQGITLWGAYSFSKGIEAVSSVRKKGSGINSYTSVNEVQFFRGGAFRFDYAVFSGNKLSLWGFYSNNYINASVDTTLDEFSSLYTDGYHRTESEINRKNSGKEIFYGGRLQFESQKFSSSKVGITYYRSKFSKPFKYKGVYEFYGDRSNALGIDYDMVLSGNVNLFGEWARSQSDKVGGISGVKMSFFRLADVLFMIRNYPANFNMLHSYGFGERSGVTQNEFGIYSGIRFRIPKLVTVNAYFDQYKFPYRTFFIPMPTRGNDFLLYTEWKVAKNLKAYTKYKHENKEDVTRTFDSNGLEVRKIYTRSQTNYRIQIDYELFSSFRIRSRAEYVFVSNEGLLPSEKGILLFSDFRVKPFRSVILDWRFIIFQTDSYDSRLYEYENEINGVVTNQGLYGKGRRWYVLLKYRPLSFLELSAKYSETVIEGAKSIGSGNDEIEGDLRNRLALQIELKF